MACFHQATNHYLRQCWPRSMSPYGVPRPQWVKHYDCRIKVLFRRRTGNLNSVVVPDDFNTGRTWAITMPHMWHWLCGIGHTFTCISHPPTEMGPPLGLLPTCTGHKWSSYWILLGHIYSGRTFSLYRWDKSNLYHSGRSVVLTKCTIISAKNMSTHMCE